MPDRQETLSIVVPCFNEAEALDNLASSIGRLEERLGSPCEFVFVDDGSSDTTYQRLSEIYRDRNGKDIRILRHARNQGLGRAIRTGLLNSKGDYIAVMDSDCTYEPIHLHRMFEIIKEDGADIIAGSPYHPQGKVQNLPAYRLFLSRNLSRMYNIVVGANIYTYTSMFRIYRAQAIKKISFKSDGFLSIAEILIKAHRQGFNIIEYPTTLTVRKYGTSKARILRMIGEHLGFIVRLLLKREEKT